MAGWTLRLMEEDDEMFVATCSHGPESEEIIASGQARLAWLRAMIPRGLHVLVAVDQGDPVGFLYAMPVGISPWGPQGEDLMVVPCLYVLKRASGQGIGRALLEQAERIAREQELSGLALITHDWDFWFMPTSAFRPLGFSEVDRREEEVLLWKQWREIPLPRLFVPQVPLPIVPGKVTIDLYWNTFCQTSLIEAQRVREVADEFGGQVLLREFCADDPLIRKSFQRSRAIFLQGREIGWGYEAPRRELCLAIEDVLRSVGRNDRKKEA